ncbi:histidine phosphatase family protein [Myroides sp. M-43]|uniref:SixA phosphatase family protein n=1 Tax=Myroides oncorhynchi TaxID=2893756 RepID=UPI001E4930D3|nr:histidine phosphatase family protein [Myroides oncorhynchi]MCC9044103.1 histidine phosphatase family protein [Myroides oncorhynchi]
MKKLILIRHAKSCWEAITDDLSRPLSKRGVNDAHLVSHALIGHLPSKVIVWTSPAKRARKTATIFCQNMEINMDCIIENRDVYTFERSQLVEAIKNCKNEHDTLILFGHNAAITKFVNKFGSETFDNVPTSGVVIINFDTDDWAAIEKGSTELTIFPRDLK